MNKRYQVFVSSTYADLREERQRVIQTLMEMDCIPSGMELFPAADDEQWEFIKRIIDDCDYYLLIIGGRYGSMTPEGISYTEKEYDYAQEIGLRVIALLHENPGNIPVDKSDVDSVVRQKLDEFRAKVSENRLVKFWSKADDLPGIVSLSLSKTIKTYPAIGWVRANQMADIDALEELNELRKENQELRTKVSQLEASAVPKVENLASLANSITVKGRYYNSYSRNYQETKKTVSWSDLFGFIAPYLFRPHADEYIKNVLEKSIWPELNASLNDQYFQTIKVQFVAQNLVTVEYSKTTKGDMALFWYLTANGNKLMMELRTIKDDTNNI
ncbi:MAG TPA: DUF4062 domain-containing protein [Methylobacter sp.]